MNIEYPILNTEYRVSNLEKELDIGYSIFDILLDYQPAMTGPLTPQGEIP